jgi:urease accessory protein UreF
MRNAQHELSRALSELKYWQRELRFRREARCPRTETIAHGERRVRTAIHWVCHWRGALRSPQRQDVWRRWQLDHWSAFVVPTQFSAQGAGR